MAARQGSMPRRTRQNVNDLSARKRLFRIRVRQSSRSCQDGTSIATLTVRQACHLGKLVGDSYGEASAHRPPRAKRSGCPAVANLSTAFGSKLVHGGALRIASPLTVSYRAWVDITRPLFVSSILTASQERTRASVHVSYRCRRPVELGDADPKRLIIGLRSVLQHA